MTAQSAVTTRSVTDLPYRRVGGAELLLDLHLPAKAASPRTTAGGGPRESVPAVVYFHGGAWRVGERTDLLDTRVLPLVERGIAVASVQYRLTDSARFPAQLLDARAALEWLRDHGADYGLLVDRIGAWGSSAGGHLAALLGLESPLDADGEPLPADRPLTAPYAAAVASWNAPLDIAASFARSWLEEEEDPVAESEAAALLGAPAYDPAAPFHQAANPVALVTRRAAPMQFVTGDRDRVVSPATSLRMHDALVCAGIESTVVLTGGAGHEDTAMDSAPNLDILAAFFRRHLLDQQ